MSVSTVAEDQHLCRCLKVSAAQVAVAIEVGGAQTVRDVSKQTGAGKACMACHCRIKQLIRERAAQRAVAACADNADAMTPARTFAGSTAAIEVA